MANYPHGVQAAKDRAAGKKPAAKKKPAPKKKADD